ncbi:hypothetical protein A2U01_0027611 [Trifolium medium]|uniref:Uncharacterized protein n=1 Tax=Trifolium medium TaxID=97028 RepID=A0A392P3B9_9FABA|nr:hypothetical protein [Trifolium medium]
MNRGCFNNAWVAKVAEDVDLYILCSIDRAASRSAWFFRIFPFFLSVDSVFVPSDVLCRGVNRGVAVPFLSLGSSLVEVRIDYGLLAKGILGPFLVFYS